MRKAGRPIDSVCSNQSPISALPARIAGGDQRGAQGNAAAGAPGQALGDRQERRDEADRVDHDDQGDERGDEEFDRHGRRSRYSFAAVFARANGADPEPSRGHVTY